MSGTAYTYSLIEMPSQIRLIQRSDGMVIPFDPANPNFVAYQAWAAAGGKPAMGSPPTSLMDAMGVLCSGLTITSTAAPALNGTYRCDGMAAAGMQAEANALMLGGTTPVFADGTTSLNWPDKSGASHTFTTAQFLELVHAVNYFVAQCAQYAAGILATAPTGTATIA